MKMAQNQTCVGIDVSQAELVVNIDNHADCQRVANEEAGWTMLEALLKDKGPVVVVLEATGGYERGVAEFLRKAGNRVWIVDPRRVRQFARASGRRAKTDPIDARMIARFGATYIDECPSTLDIGEERKKLREYVDCRRQLIEERVTISSQQRMISDDTLLKFSQERIDMINKHVGAIERIIQNIISSFQELNELNTIIQSVDGVGPVLAATILAELPELGNVDRRQLASLVGVAPFANDSGKRSFARSIAGGRASIRNTLYMAALAARNHCKPLKEFYQRLIEKGKKPKVAIVAVMRRLLGILNAIARKRVLWQEDYAHL